MDTASTTLEQTKKKFSEHLTYVGRLPVIWQPEKEDYSGERLAQINAGNLNVLNVVACTQEHRGELVDDSQLPQELLRLDAKLNLLLDLVGNLAAPQQRELDPVPVRFNAFGISWQSTSQTAADCQGLVSLYLETFRAKPLLLPARLIDTAGPNPTEDWKTAIFHGLSEQVQAAIERLVFRQHRRQIAESRQATKPTD